MTREPVVPSRPRPSLLLRLRHRGRHAVPVLVWFAAIGAIAVLAKDRRRPGAVRGIVEADRWTVTSPLDARLVTLAVSVGDVVTAGQVVARLEDESPRLRLSRARHELERLRAEMQREEVVLRDARAVASADRDVERSRERARLSRDHEEARVERLQTFAILEEARVVLRGAEDALQRHLELERGGIASEGERVALQTDRDRFTERVAELVKVLAERDARVSAARERLDDFAAAAGALPELSEFQIEPFQWRIREQEVVLEEIAHAIARCALVAPGAGVVERIVVKSGEHARAGEAVLSIVEPRPRAVVAYVPESLRDAVARETQVDVELPQRPGERRPSRVLDVSPTLVALPEPLRTDPRVAEWGLAVRIPALGDEIPGQTVLVHLTHR